MKKVNDGSENEEPMGRRELIVVGEEGTVRGEGEPSSDQIARLVGRLKNRGASLSPLFGVPPDRLLEPEPSALTEDAPGSHRADMARYFVVDAEDEQLEELAEELSAEDGVAAAYVKPAGTTPVRAEQLNSMSPGTANPPVWSPDFTPSQGYLEPAPSGVDALYASSFPGGMGRDVRIIDLEWGWRFTHEDLRANTGGVISGLSSPNDNHGTAVLGEFGGDRNHFGITGICPEATVSAVSFSLPTAQAIRIAADHLRAGDIMLLEIHRPGPNSNGVGQYGFIAIEWWPDDYAAIRYAVEKGIVVVEAAGNGYQNLDDPTYASRPKDFPADWFNPFDPAHPSSGAVLVGAGAPPPGTHGRNHGADRSRLDFSNYGARVDAQGWGREVTTTGYGNLQGGANRDFWYTDDFSGTSSASPIVVGALGCVQGILRARGARPLDSHQAIQMLRSSGSPQQDGPNGPISERIGSRPDLREMIAMLRPV